MTVYSLLKIAGIAFAYIFCAVTSFYGGLFITYLIRGHEYRLYKFKKWREDNPTGCVAEVTIMSIVWPVTVPLTLAVLAIWGSIRLCSWPFQKILYRF